MENYFFNPILNNYSNELFDLYDSYKAEYITISRFTQAEMLGWLDRFKERHIFEKSILGLSAEGREIALYKLGRGPVKVMLWTQMHGDEPTATMALIDIFNFFSKKNEHDITTTILDKLTLLAIPMLNPDGAECFNRRNAQMIDLNRDALALAAPEAKILKGICDKYRPEYGFNLHDQEPHYTVGTTRKITAVALLAPAVDESRSDNSVRLRAKKIASVLAQILELFIPGRIAKWDDTFCPNAFGDNIQKWGTSTVLIESGGWRGDPDKFFIRKLNCVSLLAALYAIAADECRNADTAIYERIPANMELGFDYIIRNAVIRTNDNIDPVRVDVGVNIEKHINVSTRRTEESAIIADIGDLSGFAALEKDVDAAGTELNIGPFELDRPFAADKIMPIINQM